MNMRILILGTTGMLGRELFYQFSQNLNYTTYGTRRTESNNPRIFKAEVNKDIHISQIEEVIKEVRPKIVINCIGAIKQKDYEESDLFYLNSLLPHQLSICCTTYCARLIHISTDCVFSGDHGMYDENSIPDPLDSYGISKAAGEVDSYDHITVRTSIIGHEAGTSYGLVDWFLNNSDGEEVKGFLNAIYTGMPTCCLAQVLHNVIIPSELKGIWNVSVEPISKFNLLNIINRVYGRNIKITPNDSFYCDRSLDSHRIRNIFAWEPKSWNEMIKEMHESYVKDNERNDIQE